MFGANKEFEFGNFEFTSINDLQRILIVNDKLIPEL